MTILCIGWGSLISDPRELPVRGSWNDDGPELPLEFARLSGGGRVTLVITPGGRLLRTLWCELDASDLPTAARALRKREGTILERIGIWSKDTDNASNEYARTVDRWARPRGYEGVVWTALPPKWADEDGRIPELNEVVEYLRQAPVETLKSAADYIRTAPDQIQTNYRAALEKALAVLGV